jgi:hypothetical protein
MLQKSAAFVPRNWRFESSSLQQRVERTPTAAAAPAGPTRLKPSPRLICSSCSEDRTREEDEARLIAEHKTSDIGRNTRHEIARLLCRSRRQVREANHSKGGGFARRFCFRRAGRRNCSPCWRTIAAAGLRRMPTAPRSSMKVHSAAIRLTTSSGVNIDAIAITSTSAIQRDQCGCCARILGTGHNSRPDAASINSQEFGLKERRAILGATRKNSKNGSPDLAS